MDRDAFGWVHLRQVDGKYQMVGNAMAYESRGIIVGTTQVVPEPAALWLVAVAALATIRKPRR
jgi:MYXO-CTERM domain-containing protein